ncbi:hypothetical protein [Paenibacillus eucommiae]|uniref:Uncharacterized protein n=1 Tax=Paenibacillus eucommiae TaxID=1355755 RepID=A0ABS4J5Z4_9BACL|nr:hypothetical protein [Paenibacillus eucommiae]MBP1995243.1 hypothetical protein [Paenibacillus eucommiae]
MNEHDGLYWRLSSDSISDVFGFIVTNAPTSVSLPQTVGQRMNTTERKLAQASVTLPAGISGIATYTNHLVDRKVTFKLQSFFKAPFRYFKVFGSEMVHGQASSRVVEPVEMIRLTDMTRTYIKTIKERISPKAAKALLVEPQNSSGAKVAITSEKEAAAYLRSLVNGTLINMQTPTGKNRTIDALDANGVAHIAFYTFTENQLRTVQLPKDIELLKQGTQLKGVVWHFFKKNASGIQGPSEKLRKELEDQGIVVVIHN